MSRIRQYPSAADRQRAYRSRKRHAQDGANVTPLPMGRLFRGDCRAILATLPAQSAQLVLTSSPYNVGYDYADGGAGDRLPLANYLDLLTTSLAACYRVLHPGGVLALNLPPSIRQSEHRAYPISAWAQMHLLDAGWLLREPLTWVKAQKDRKPHASSLSFGAPTNVYLRPTHEHVILASKETFTLPDKNRHWNIDGYLEVVKDTWLLPPATARKGDPPSFPPELARRLILLYSSPGSIVLDPFAGTGVVGAVARQLGRVPWLIERQPSYWPRLEAAVGQGVGRSSAPGGQAV